MTEKEKILQALENKNINKADFFKNLGVTYSNFNGVNKSKPLRTDILVKILSEIPDLSAEWLLRGTGDMFITDNQLTSSQQINGNGNSGNVVNAGTGSEQVVEILMRQLEEKDEQIRQLMQHLK